MNSSAKDITNTATVTSQDLRKQWEVVSKSSSQWKNESDIREDFLTPILTSLGYKNDDQCRMIERNVPLKYPKIHTGTTTKDITYYPDYILNINNERKIVIDAKHPQDNVLDVQFISQVFSYATHREINAKLFAITNGFETAIFRTADSDYQPITIFKLNEYPERSDEMFEMLSAQSFMERMKSTGNSKIISLASDPLIQKDITNAPISRIIEPNRQSSKIHHGVHPYFTRRPWNVVKAYIEHFSKEDDLVLDSFGGTGVTAIEAARLGRRAIHIDINPISVFMAEALSIPIDISDMSIQFTAIWESLIEYSKLNQRSIDFWYPKNVKLPNNSDVEYLHDLFSQRQLRLLSFLANNIRDIKNDNMRKIFLLIFSSTLVKCNISFHNTPRPNGIPGGGDAGFLKYYRYQVPRTRDSEEDVVSVFREKYLAMSKCKQQINIYNDRMKSSRLKFIKGTARDLAGHIHDSSVDYVFVDPPYEGKINYLDLSIIWNSWLQLPVSNADFVEEIIIGGSRKKSEEDYLNRLKASIGEIGRVLKNDKWASLVFASSNPHFWHAIRDFSSEAGLEHINTVCQPSTRKTVKKNQNPLTVFNGELILNFRKRKSAVGIVNMKSSVDVKEIIITSAQESIVSHNGEASIEIIMADLVPRLWETGSLSSAAKLGDITSFLKENFEFDEEKSIWRIKDKIVVSCHIPIEKRIRFYILNVLNKAKVEGRFCSVDEIVLEVMPFLRNGTTPSNQSIMSELRLVGYSRDGVHWEINPKNVLF